MMDLLGGLSAVEDDPTVMSLLDSTDHIVRRTTFGYTAELSDKTLEKIRKHPRVALVEEDKVIKIALDESSQVEPHAAFYVEFMLQKDSPWGLSRVSGLENSYEYIPDGGKDVTVYILDTGVDTTHPEFEGRALFGYNAVNSIDTDEHGHGTHCAGVVGSKTFGVAKKVSLVAVKVLDKWGIGSISRLIEGIDFVINDHWNRVQEYNDKTSIPYIMSSNYLANGTLDMYPSNVPIKKPKSVISMSIGGERSMALNHVIMYASKAAGIHFSTAAGNENKDACSYSPSSSSTSLTIGASNIENRVAQFSNQGKCVDVYAPGTSIPSTWPHNATKTISGTSMAAPHVSGIMAIYLGLADFEPKELKNRIILDSVKMVGSLEPRLLWPFKRRRLRPLASLKTLYSRIKAYEGLHSIYKH